jgi:hypothetical protein
MNTKLQSYRHHHHVPGSCSLFLWYRHFIGQAFSGEWEHQVVLG